MVGHMRTCKHAACNHKLLYRLHEMLLYDNAHAGTGHHGLLLGVSVSCRQGYGRYTAYTFHD